MGPAAVAELTREAEAEGPDVGLDAGGVVGGGNGFLGFDSEEGGGASGEDVGEGGWLGGAGGGAWGGEGGGDVDEGGFGVVVEAELAGGVLGGLVSREVV